MFNTMTITKAAGAIIAPLLFLLLVAWGASGLYHVGSSEHGGEGEHAQAYTVAVTESAGGDKASAGDDAAAEAAAFDAAYASADAAAGEKVFGKCKACHKIDGSNGTGPHLDGVVGRAVASVAGFNYDDAMKKHADEAPDWTPEALSHFLNNPKKAVPGTKMSFAGLPKVEDRANLIKYLSTLQ
ncbi:c-type cytochrome [Paracoccus aminophilus]|uniref:Cytochrome c-552 n=1 Tax=Paracoccus aminophilus JCM 7686 TaxID=1367847 RepID=S5XPI8_PARAH|nr:cytochrome c family protein [Paracoccus aminophilus]AGT09254.1 cytochrome c-552 [Paracoccus aminophilus JCM 7686]